MLSETRTLLKPNLVNQVFDRGANSFYENLGKHYQLTIANRLARASRLTPYAPGSIGTRQRFSGRIRGIPPANGGATFGVDSGAFRSTVTTNLDIGADGAFTIYSDLVYSRRLASLFEQKGSFAGEGLFQFQSEDVDEAEKLIGELIDNAF